jgi:sulfate adenylyltransferase subunit 1 (EFTu-like GTPase family)
MPKLPRGYRTIKLALKNETVPVHASARVADALQKITAEMPLYDGVKLMQILEAAYKQGKKDGSREVFEQVDAGLEATRKAIKHRNPGRPKGS